VVSMADYKAYIASQKASGHNGILGDDYNPNQNLPGTGAPKG
jgi:cytochrome c oxidase subunit 2